MNFMRPLISLKRTKKKRKKGPCSWASSVSLVSALAEKVAQNTDGVWLAEQSPFAEKTKLNRPPSICDFLHQER
jgi:hypothetical protein